MDEALQQIIKAVELNPDNGSAHINLGHMLEVRGGHREEAKAELLKGLDLSPKSSDGHNVYGVILAREGRMEEAISELQKGVDLAPRSAECRFNLGRALAANNRFADAVPQFEAAAGLTGNNEPAILQMLAGVYSETGQSAKAIATAEKALTLAEQRNDSELAGQLKANLARYRSMAGN
jgi:superkiller protein 3